MNMMDSLVKDETTLRKNEGNWIDLQRVIAPEIGELIETRFNILSIIKVKQPIGRRHLAAILDMSERQVRNEIEFLQGQALICVERQGVMMTDMGAEIMERMENLLYHYNGLEQREREMAELLGIRKVCITPGNSGNNDQVLAFMGRTAADYIVSVLGDRDILAMSGGKSTAAIAEQMRDKMCPGVCVIPARGGTGRSHSIQANNVAAGVAEKLHAQYEMLHLPDNLDEELLNALKEYPEIKRVFDKMAQTKVFVFGIGKAEELAASRNLSTDIRDELKRNDAVAEAFGHYLKLNGEEAVPIRAIGISLADYQSIEHVVAIAGGAKKARAIIAVARINPNLVLFTDESAAKAMTEIIKNQDFNKRHK